VYSSSNTLEYTSNTLEYTSNTPRIHLEYMYSKCIRGVFEVYSRCIRVYSSCLRWGGGGVWWVGLVSEVWVGGGGVGVVWMVGVWVAVIGVGVGLVWCGWLVYGRW
jgi:hypothetical protein